MDGVSDGGSGLTDGRHARAEEASLALHRVVAERLLADPSLLEKARARVARWLAEGSVGRATAEAWREVLSGSPAEVVRFLADPGPRARDLRQTSPFAGALRPRERWAILRQVKRSSGRS